MRLSVFILLVWLCLPAIADNEGLLQRAQRAYNAHEWPQAQALYMLITDTDSAMSLPFARALIVSDMRGDTTSQAQVFERALARGIPMDSVFVELRAASFSLGKGGMYCSILHRLSEQLPYLRRPIDARLLDYYIFRRDYDKVELYARRMLAGLPEDVRYLIILGRAQTALGKKGEAAATWRKVISIDADNVEALTSLGNALFNESPGEARQVLQHAYELSGNNYLKTLIDKLQ